MQEKWLQSRKFRIANVANPNTSQTGDTVDAVIFVNNTLITSMKQNIFDSQLLQITSVALKST